MSDINSGDVHSSRPAASDQLAAVARAYARTTAVVQMSRRSNGWFVVTLGLLFGALIAGVGFTEHSSPAGLIISIFAFTIILQIVMFSRQKTKIATAKGWSRRTGWAFAITLILYVAGVCLAAFEAIGPTPAFWVPYALATAAPMVVVGLVDVLS
jgi:hypothetical protein